MNPLEAIKLGLIPGTWCQIPAPFSISLPFIVQSNGTEFRAWDTALNKEWDPADYAPAVLKTYYVALTGNDADTGTEAEPLATIAAAVAKADVDRVIILDQGPYHYGASAAGIVLARNMSIIGHASGTVLTAARTLVWSATGAASYTANLTGVSNIVFDATNLDGNGEMRQLAIVANAATVDATPNSVFVSGADIYVRTFDGRSPDSDLRVRNATDNVLRIAAAGRKLYVENLRIYHGADMLFARAGGELRAKNCEIAYGTQGVRNLGCITQLKGVTVHHCHEDGIDYADYLTYTDAEGVEVDVVSRDNGLLKGDHANNGTTCHEASKAFCLNSQYYGNEGRNVADIGVSQRWMVACTSRDSAATDATYDENFVNGTSGDADIMWLDSCVSSGSNKDLNTGTAGNIYVRNLTDDGNYLGTNPPRSYIW